MRNLTGVQNYFLEWEVLVFCKFQIKSQIVEKHKSNQCQLKGLYVQDPCKWYFKGPRSKIDGYRPPLICTPDLSDVTHNISVHRQACDYKPWEREFFIQHQSQCWRIL